MKYLRKFGEKQEYDVFTERQDYSLPNVCLVENEIIFNSDIEPFYVEAIDDLVIYPTKTWFLYSYDNVNWEPLTTSASTSPTHVAGKRVYIKASGYSVSSSAGIGTFRFSGRCKVGGNIRLMLTEALHDNTVAFHSYILYQLFKSATSLVSAKDLVIDGPMNSYVCYEMFNGCSSLVDPPIILTKELVNSYSTFYQMFYNCSSLIKAPIIRIESASLSSNKTFMGMLRGCSSLNYIKTWLNINSIGSSGSLNYWTEGVPSEGVFVINAAAKSKWNSGIPTGWEIKLCDIDTDETYIEFKIGSTTYKSDDGMTWADWIASDYNTAGLTSDDTNVLSGSSVLNLGDTPVLATDLVKCINGTNYSF